MAEALLASDPITVAFTAGQPLRLRHGLGREPKGWLVIWADNFVTLRAGEVADPRQELELVSDATALVRLLLL